MGLPLSLVCTKQPAPEPPFGLWATMGKKYAADALICEIKNRFWYQPPGAVLVRQPAFSRVQAENSFANRHEFWRRFPVLGRSTKARRNGEGNNAQITFYFTVK